MILLLGATGYIGQAFSDELRGRGKAFVPLTRNLVDYTRFDVLFDYVRSTRPDFVINAAGYPGTPDLDACEIHRAETVRANTLLPQTVARVCYLMKTPWGHISSGSIFSGAKLARNGGFQIERDLGRPELRSLLDAQPDAFRGFAEFDEPNFSFRSPPCNFYSGTKALAEEALRWTNQCYLWRPHLLFDACDHPRNFLSQIQRSAHIHDSVNSLTHRGDFVRACLDLWERCAPFGIYNIVNPGAVSGRQIVEVIRHVFKPVRPFEFWKSDEEFQRSGVKAIRSNCILDSAKILSTGIKIRSVTEAIKDSLETWKLSAPNQNWMQAIQPAFTVK
jgi:UDP-glucose 4,6-dehydratase